MNVGKGFWTTGCFPGAEPPPNSDHDAAKTRMHPLDAGSAASPAVENLILSAA